MAEWNIEQVSELTNLSVKSIRVYQYRGSFPPPDFYVGKRAYWRGLTVAIWLQNRRRPGRPSLKEQAS